MTKKLIKIGVWVVVIVIIAPDAMSIFLGQMTDGILNMVAGTGRILGDKVGHSMFGGSWSWIKKIF